ncbi:MAG: tyrosine-type recombinase/integrase [Actinomycetota bacterium]|nr:tyrosine-type recombinase/integrase [Actinomycetota bacterium]
MQGFIRKRGNTYTAYWSTNDPATGKRVQHSKGGFRRKEPARPIAKGDSAREFLNAVVGQVQEGRWRPDQRLTVRELFEDHFLPAKRASGLKETTIVYYETAVRAWILPHIGGVPVTALTPKMVTQLAEKLRTEGSVKGRGGLKQTTTHVAVRTLRAGFAWAVDNDLLGRNPIAGVRYKRGGSDAMRVWTVAQTRAFLDATRDDPLAWAWSLLFSLGPRRGELCGLRWEDIEFFDDDAREPGSPAGLWRVGRSRVYTKGLIVESGVKSLDSRRSLPLDDLVVARLRTHKARQAAQKLAAGEAYDDRGYLFADELGVPCHPQTLYRRFLATVERVGAELELPRIRLHDTRHSAATQMLAAGEPVKVVQEVLGHSSPSITSDIYSHLLPGMKESAVTAQSARLLGPAATQPEPSDKRMTEAEIVGLPPRPEEL